ncbi:hypothetical protein [Halomonas sp. CKK8]|uniref:hypothetical protein n=1 Tax=Halomonas sp. CKK8 TaxID=3036127 RepID=UPI0024157EBE|nr:hypothetical protein [Halomonas sp. CKK8]WFM72972.1 hypothetical protein P8934_08240 [Halomonas sp. CKK8]
MTKEQVGEWRRKEAYLLCEDLEQNYKHIGIDITQTINNIKWMNKNSTHSYYALCKILPLITSGSKNTAYGKCIKYLDFINLHFEAIGKAGTIEARDLIGAVYLLHLKINASNNIPDEKVDEEEIKTAINRINETSIAFE